MNRPELERLRRRVEAGDLLSDDELDGLAAATRESSLPWIRLCLAHALIERDRAEEALAVLSPLRDARTDTQTILARARALVALDRLDEGERAVQEALARTPDDPEAKKALALLLLRRGELGRARALVEEVQRRDPFDDEARLVRAELDAVGETGALSAAPSGVPELGVDALAEGLLARLAAREVAALRRGDELLVRTGRGAVSRLDLPALVTRLRQDGAPLEVALDALADSLPGPSRLPSTPERLLAQVLPVLRDAAFAARATGAAFREGPAGLLVFYVLDDPALVRHVPQGLLERLALPLDRVDEAAFRNLAATPTPLVRVGVGPSGLQPSEDGPLVALAAGDGHDGARLLLPDTPARLAQALGPGPWRVALPARELALAGRADDRPAADALARLAITTEGLPVALRLEPGGRLEAIGPSSGAA